MPLVFSPLSEDVLVSPPRGLHPKCAFIMRQIGDPPDMDSKMVQIVLEEPARRDIRSKDADATTGGKDFLERILGLIRGTGFTIAIFSHETRPTAMANIALELGFAAMCGKPLVIIKSKSATAPSDFKRTDWIDYDDHDEDRFRSKIQQAFDTIDEIARFEDVLLDVALNARSIDCAVAFERANKAFLLTSDPRFLDQAEQIKRRLDAFVSSHEIDDLERLRSELSTFVQQGRRALLTAVS